MNECQQSEKVSAYHDGEMPAALRQEMERHLEQCPRCQAELEELRELSASLGTLPIPQASPAVLARMHRQVDQLAARSIYRLMEAGAAIAAAVLIVCMVGLLRQGPVPAPAPAPWEAQAAYGSTVDLASGGSEAVLAGWTVQDLGNGEHE
jgi:RNA polymerase sigma-70 factor (ECF subfamily)